MDKAFTRALTFTLAWEGGYINHAKDPGGETKYGISKRAYPHIDIKTLTHYQAAEIYHRDYWKASGCPGLNRLVAFAQFDCAVNSGRHRATKLMQRVIGEVEDGLLGPITLARGGDWPPRLLACGMVAQRELFLVNITRNNPDNLVFLRGWMRRTSALMQLINENG